MTRDQSGTWEMESNDNFEGYMKALGKKEAADGGVWRTLGGLWSGPPHSAAEEFIRPVCKPHSSLSSCVILDKSDRVSGAQVPHLQDGNNNKEDYVWNVLSMVPGTRKRYTDWRAHTPRTHIGTHTELNQI